jgi:hypothetical protein
MPTDPRSTPYVTYIPRGDVILQLWESHTADKVVPPDKVQDAVVAEGLVNRQRMESHEQPGMMSGDSWIEYEPLPPENEV